MTDLALAQRGDPDAFARLVRDRAPRVVALARAIVGDADAEDVAQEAFLRAWRSLATLGDPDRFDAWLSAIVRHAARNRLRDREAERRTLPPLPAPPAREDDHSRLRAAVDSLPEEQREVLRLRYEAGLSYAGIAASLEIDAALVKSRLHEARERLEKILGP